jgi:uncharacterized membrane protein
MIEYIIAYICGGVIGWLIEYFISKKDNTYTQQICADTFNRKYLHMCIPFLNIWAIGSVILLLINNNFQNYDKLVLAFISGLLLTIMECVGGHISYYINKYQTWNYKDHAVPICHGYCSLNVGLCWSAISLIFFTSVACI